MIFSVVFFVIVIVECVVFPLLSVENISTTGTQGTGDLFAHLRARKVEGMHLKARLSMK